MQGLLEAAAGAAAESAKVEAGEDGDTDDSRDEGRSDMCTLPVERGWLCCEASERAEPVELEPRELLDDTAVEGRDEMVGLRCSSSTPQLSNVFCAPSFCSLSSPAAALALRCLSSATPQTTTKYERHNEQASAKNETKKRQAGEPASWRMESVLVLLASLSAERPSDVTGKMEAP